MSASHQLTSGEIRKQLGHPVIDADGHVLELLPAVYPFIRDALGPKRFEAYLRQGPPMRRKGRKRSLDELLRSRAPLGAWWAAVSENTLDRATVMFPRLLGERMQELGIDYSILYTSHGLSTCAIPDEELRLGTIRGFNEYYAEIYGPHAEHMAAAGMIPMHTPQEAIGELRHCAELGLKVVSFPEGVLRPIEAGPSSNPQLYPQQAHWFDTFGLDSAFDYDPVWRTARELGYAVTFHGALGMRPAAVSSPTSYVYNHVGMFASLVAPVCKSLFLGGVTRRFPDLAFAFLECGVSWATQMLCDLIEHWERRNLGALGALDPRAMKIDELEDLFEKYGGVIRDRLEGEFSAAMRSMPIDLDTPVDPDEWKHLQIESPKELVELFVPNFYFGCEAGDRGIATAFPPIPPLGSRLNAIFSSDMGHWDVTDIAEVLPEAHGLIESGLVGQEDFRRFTFENPARLYMTANPSFFDGTTLADAAATLR